MELLPYFERPLSSLNVEVPADLTSVVKQLASVRRFVNDKYPKGVIVDDVRSHLFRMQAILADLPLERSMKQRASRIIWIHDWPEIADENDLTALEAYHRPDLRENKERLEAAFVEKHFKPADQTLFLSYSLASNWFKVAAGIVPPTEDIDQEVYSQAALVAKMLDWVDGHITFHRCLSTWMTGPTELPPDDALLFGLGYMQRLKLSLERSRFEVAPLILGLGHSARQAVYQLWTAEECRYTPPAIAKFFEEHPPIISVH